MEKSPGLFLSIRTLIHKVLNLHIVLIKFYRNSITTLRILNLIYYDIILCYLLCGCISTELHKTMERIMISCSQIPAICFDWLSHSPWKLQSLAEWGSELNGSLLRTDVSPHSVHLNSTDFELQQWKHSYNWVGFHCEIISQNFLIPNAA